MEPQAKDVPQQSAQEQRTPPTEQACPDCGTALTRQSGCVVCMTCGWARCD